MAFAWWKPLPVASLLLVLSFPLLLVFVLSRSDAHRSPDVDGVPHGSDLPKLHVSAPAPATDSDVREEEILKLPATVAAAAAAADPDFGVGKGSSSISLRNEGKRKLLALPSPISEGDTFVLAFLDGSILLVDGKKEAVHGSFSTGGPLTTSYQAFTHDDVDGYLYCGDDWALYEHNKDFGKKKLETTIDEYVNMTPITCVDGGHLLGSTKSTEFLFDSRTGEIISSYWMDDLHGVGTSSDEDNKAVVPKLQTASPQEDSAQSYAKDTSVNLGIFYIIRKDYTLRRYTKLRKLSWNMSVSYIEARSCVGGKCKQLPVYPQYKKNPFPPRLRHIGQFELPEAGLQSGIQLKSLPRQNLLTLDMPNSTKESSISELMVNNNSTDAAGVVIQGGSLNVTNLTDFKGAPQVSNGYASWYYVIFLPVLVLLYNFVKKSLRYDKQPTDLFKKQTTAAKKRKTRKANSKHSSLISKNNFSTSNSDDAETDDQKHGSKNDKDSLLKLLGGCESNDGRWVGKLFVSDIEIAKGSNGTVVFEGIYDGRPVAVKRLVRAHHDVASKEIQNLIASDQHPNIVRWFGVEYDSDFVYLSLERCACSLNDLIQSYSDSSVADPSGDSPSLVMGTTYKIKLSLQKFSDKDVELWKENGCPSSHMIKLMRDIVLGLAHLHELGIVHRDLKPQNVLVNSHKVFSAKLSDMGISKHLPDEMSSLGRHATGHGSTGWQAPEQLIRGRQTRAVDLFSLGCVLFFCITKGKHPYGSYFERDANILSNRYDLFLVEHIPEAVHLFSNLLNPDPDLRPKAIEVLQHPLFWDSETRLSFLRDTSDRVELEDRENGSELLRALERIAPIAFGGKWGEKLDTPFIADMGRYRKYKFESTRDLLRVIRNKLNHYLELPKELKGILGSFPEGFDDYFARRFPRLLIEVYKVVYLYCREDDLFRKYFRSTTL